MNKCLYCIIYEGSSVRTLNSLLIHLKAEILVNRLLDKKKKYIYIYIYIVLNFRTDTYLIVIPHNQVNQNKIATI